MAALKPVGSRTRNLSAVVSVGAAAVVLLLALGIVIHARYRSQKHAPGRGAPSSLVPSVVAGWVVNECPIGPTEALAKHATETLRFDSYIYRRFSRPPVDVGVYVAYWGPDRVPISEVSKHTPDVCWPLSGTPLVATRGRVQLSIGEQVLPAAEVREFGVSGSTRHLIYWHLVNGVSVDHSRRLGWSLQGAEFWREAIRQLWAEGKPEQWLIRIDSNVAIADLLREPDFAGAMQALARLLGGLDQVAGPVESSAAEKR